MKRIAAWLVGPLMLVGIGFAAAPATAATVRPLSEVNVPGNYTAYAKYGTSTKWVAFSLTLRADHTGTDHFNDTIVWSISGKDLTMNFDDGLWTYLGHKTRAGFNNKSNPGTLSNVNGGTGVWYAVRL